jgi:hypothetical protein
VNLLPGRRSRCQRLVPSEPTTPAPPPTRLIRGNADSRHQQAQPKQRSQLSWLRTEDTARLPELLAALSQRRPPDRAQAQAADRCARAASPSDIERRSAQTATWQEAAPASPTGLSPGSEPSTTTEPRDINKPPTKTGPAASSRPLPDEERISGCCKTAPRFAPNAKRSSVLHTKQAPDLEPPYGIEP